MARSRLVWPLALAVMGTLAALTVILSACGERVERIVTPPRPTVIVITASGPYFATFDTTDGWLLGESERSRGEVIEGAYHLHITEPRYVAWTHQTLSFGEGIYEVDARLVSGPEASAFGLLLLGSTDLRSFFYSMITGDGRFDVGFCEDACRTQESLVGGPTLSYAILTGNQTNRLHVELSGDTLTFRINGTLVSQVSGLSYSEGLVGLVGESAQYGGFEASFDNLQVVEAPR